MNFPAEYIPYLKVGDRLIRRNTLTPENLMLYEVIQTCPDLEIYNESLKNFGEYHLINKDYTWLVVNDIPIKDWFNNCNKDINNSNYQPKNSKLVYFE